MPYTQEDGGRLNNFAVEPTVYQSEPPTGNEKKNFVILGVFATALLAGVIFVAVYASNTVS